jgi:general secretion pathway protein I
MGTLGAHGERDGGFTLIEVLVSFAILVAAVSVLQGGFGGGWRGIRAADMETEALEIAKAKLAALGVETALEPGVTEGEAGDGFSWTSTIVQHEAAPAIDANADTAADQVPRGYWTTVQVRWNDGRGRDARQISLTTLKIRRLERTSP